MAARLVAAIETGGTKLLARICGVEDVKPVAEGKWATRSADEAANDLVDFLSPLKSDLAAIGMAAFGPLIVDPDSPHYGQMLATTKPGWTGSNLRKQLEDRLGVPVIVDTDVNAAAIAEQEAGAGEGLPNIAYVTVGTGIGAGFAQRGQTLKGSLHPEAGHLPLIRWESDQFPSICPFHQNCAEGLVSGPALTRRLGDIRDLADDPALMALVADYLGQLAASLVMAWSPDRIVWGGGVIVSTQIVEAIQQRLRAALNDYGVGPAVGRPGFCVQAKLENAGLDGAMLMARREGE